MSAGPSFFALYINYSESACALVSPTSQFRPFSVGLYGLRRTTLPLLAPSRRIDTVAGRDGRGSDGCRGLRRERRWSARALSWEGLRLDGLSVRSTQLLCWSLVYCELARDVLSRPRVQGYWCSMFKVSSV